MGENKITFGTLVLWVNLSQIFYMGLYAMGQEILQKYGVGVLEYSFGRALILLGLSYVNLTVCKQNPFEYGDNFKPCMIRAIVGTISFTTMNIGMMNLPLAIFTVIFNSTPFFTAILAYLYLKESITVCEVVAMAGSFSGIILIAFSTP